MTDIYTTALGDTFDSIAFLLYGDEKYMKELIEANWDKADTLVFESGVQIFAPDVYEEEDEDLPFWREEDEEEEDVSEDDDAFFYYEYTDDEEDEDLTDAESEEESPDSEEDEDDG